MAFTLFCGFDLSFYEGLTLSPPLILPAMQSLSKPPPNNTHMVIISIGNEEEGIGIESHAD